MVAEKGHAANRLYFSDDGNLHLNGGKVFTSTEADITSTLDLTTNVTATPTELNVLGGVTPGTTTASKALVVDASKTLDVLTATTLTTLTAVNQLQRLSPAPTDTYGSAMTIDVTYSFHVVAGLFATSASVTYTPSAAGTAGDLLVIRTASGAGGTVTATFATTFHSSGTQATTTGHWSTIMFVSDGTRWLEVRRTTALA